MLGHSGTSCAIRLKNTYGCYRPGARARERDSRFATAKRRSRRVRVIEVFRLTHHFSRPGFTGCRFGGNNGYPFFNCRGESLLLATTHLIFSHASALSSGSNGFLWETGWRAFAVFGGRLGSLVCARFVPLVIALGSALSSSLLSFLARVSSHLISSRLVSSCRANSISLLLFPPDLFFSQAISRSAKQGAWGGNIANLHWKGGHSKPHTYLFHHPIAIFSIFPFLTTANLAGSRTATTSRSIGRLGY